MEERGEGSMMSVMSDVALDTRLAAPVDRVPPAPRDGARDAATGRPRAETARPVETPPPPPPPDARTLRFGRTDAGQLVVGVYDGDGRLVRSIPPNAALARAMGAMTWQG